MTASGNDGLNYEFLLQEAFHGLLARVLEEVERLGKLPGEHHFFFEIDTQHPQVKLSRQLLKRFPSKLSIVLQHQFANLTVDKKGFSVTLFFSGVPENVYVPFRAVRLFRDPHAEFALQFEGWKAGEGKTIAVKEKLPRKGTTARTRPAKSRKRKARKTGEVVQLDAFRPKTP